MRNSHTVGMQPNETATQTDEVSVDEDVGEAAACSFTEWRCATKKELRLHKAIKELNKAKSLESMGKEIAGVAKRKAWRPTLKSMLTKTQRKKTVK